MAKKCNDWREKIHCHSSHQKRVLLYRYTYTFFYLALRMLSWKRCFQYPNQTFCCLYMIPAVHRKWFVDQWILTTYTNSWSELFLRHTLYKIILWCALYFTEFSNWWGSNDDDLAWDREHHDSLRGNPHHRHALYRLDRAYKGFYDPDPDLSHDKDSGSRKLAKTHVKIKQKSIKSY